MTFLNRSKKFKSIRPKLRSVVTSLIRHPAELDRGLSFLLALVIWLNSSLQCYDTVGWATGRASGL